MKALRSADVVPTAFCSPPPEQMDRKLEAVQALPNIQEAAKEAVSWQPWGAVPALV